ncbi:putative 8-amino-7-oxononanoate synthase [Tolypocladium ophioglossoides CBS 100239]|uniref:Putative 8-amino-7-oxononanoate synthase n=1 Tax=Tolypocladium ophioglossoides (strain CBS 100239) TaxID=1163406 RepID=A0A0L0NBX1_TOLOC|nr:putative 8-amino-7-oxononanoate synthase [Tolypocladium ophioglossoides CBS 100239]
MGHKANRLDDVYESLLARRGSQGRLRRLTLPEPGLVDFSSNGYLSLATNPDIRSAYLSRLQSSGDGFSLGSGGSRLLDGNTTAAEALEATVAAFHGAPAGLLFNSGFEANTGLFGCAPQPGDVVVYDELIHASVHDGMRLGRARTVPFAHNCVRGEPESETEPAATSPGGDGRSLDEVLAALTRGDEGGGLRSGRASVFVVVEGVYSMDGDRTPLREIADCVEARLPRGNGCIVVDEAHSTGWLGERGRGLVCHLGLEDRVWARVHTFGKAMGCAGGASPTRSHGTVPVSLQHNNPPNMTYTLADLTVSTAIVLCSPATRAYLVNYARSLIYTTAMGFPLLASIQTAYAYLDSGRAAPHLAHLDALGRHAHRLLASLCARRRPPPCVLRLGAGPPESPIVPLFTARARSLAQHCQRRGFMVRPIVAPTVPAGMDRVRLCLHAGNTVEEVQGLCAAMEEWVCGRLAEAETETETETQTQTQTQTQTAAGADPGHTGGSPRAPSKL